MSTSPSAIPPDVDLRRYAHLLACVHDAVLSGARPPAPPRRLIESSWARVLAARVDPDQGRAVRMVSPEELEHRREQSPLREVLDELRACLASEPAEDLLVLADADGVVLWSDGPLPRLRQADRLGFVPGADWSEEAVGTNAIGTALVTGMEVQVFAAEHFVRSHHPWTCTAGPVHDPASGALVGCIDVSGPAGNVNPTTFVVVRTAMRLAEAQLRQRHHARLASLRALAAPTLAALPGSGAVVDADGWLAAARGASLPDRITLPADPLGDVISLGGLGACRAEPLGGGWLLRPSSQHRSVRLRVDASTDPPVAVLEGTSACRVPLSPRQAELLLLLAGAVHGWSAGQLSVAMFGDDTHQVAVRAEVSRLRRRLNGVIATRPYRIADNVEVARDDLARLRATGRRAGASLAG
jgi:hypothetical protein